MYLPARHFSQRRKHYQIESNDAANRIAGKPKHHHFPWAIFAIDFQGCKCEGLAWLHFDLQLFSGCSHAHGPHQDCKELM